MHFNEQIQKGEKKKRELGGGGAHTLVSHFRRGLAIKSKVHPGFHEEQVWDKRLLVETEPLNPFCQTLPSGMCSYFNELSFKNQLVPWKWTKAPPAPVKAHQFNRPAWESQSDFADKGEVFISFRLNEPIWNVMSRGVT